MINKIKGLSQSLETKINSPSKAVGEKSENDKIHISEEAKLKATELKLQADVQEITKKVLSLPTESDRAQKIKEVKEKLARGEYDNPTLEVLNGAADRLLLNVFSSQEI